MMLQCPTTSDLMWYIEWVSLFSHIANKLDANKERRHGLAFRRQLRVDARKIDIFNHDLRMYLHAWLNIAKLATAARKVKTKSRETWRPHDEYLANMIHDCFRRSQHSQTRCLARKLTQSSDAPNANGKGCNLLAILLVINGLMLLASVVLKRVGLHKRLMLMTPFVDSIQVARDIRVDNVLAATRDYNMLAHQIRRAGRRRDAPTWVVPNELWRCILKATLVHKTLCKGVGHDGMFGDPTRSCSEDLKLLVLIRSNSCAPSLCNVSIGNRVHKKSQALVTYSYLASDARVAHALGALPEACYSV